MKSDWLKIRSWKFWFLVFIIVNVLDLHSTALLIIKAGIEVELNPIIAFFYQKWGFLGMGLYKAVVICGVFGAMRMYELLHPIRVKIILWLSIAVFAIMSFGSYFVYFAHFA